MDAGASSSLPTRTTRPIPAGKLHKTLCVAHRCRHRPGRALHPARGGPRRGHRHSGSPAAGAPHCGVRRHARAAAARERPVWADRLREDLLRRPERYGDIFDLRRIHRVRRLHRHRPAGSVCRGGSAARPTGAGVELLRQLHDPSNGSIARSDRTGRMLRPHEDRNHRLRRGRHHLRSRSSGQGRHHRRLRHGQRQRSTARETSPRSARRRPAPRRRWCSCA